jgi:hypothetical protein
MTPDFVLYSDFNCPFCYAFGALPTGSTGVASSTPPTFPLRWHARALRSHLNLRTRFSSSSDLHPSSAACRILFDRMGNQSPDWLRSTRFAALFSDHCPFLSRPHNLVQCAHGTITDISRLRWSSHGSYPRSPGYANRSSRGPVPWVPVKQEQHDQ